jgi:amino acid adenylation domain-containing protein
MTGHFVNILRALVSQPEGRLAELEMVSAEEREGLLHAWNQTTVSYPVKTMVQLFEEQVAATPDQPALALGETTLTYRELSEAADLAAVQLRTAGVRTGQVVGLMAQRSFEMLIGLFGIWKAGGAYLPMDPTYPLDRIRYMIEDSGIAVLVAQKSPMVETVLAGAEVQDLQVVYLADGAVLAAHATVPEAVMAVEVKPADLAYIIYTSGSTGKPKGVLVQHQSAANTLQWRRAEYGMTTADRVLQLFSFSFDGFLTSCMTPLFSGATAVLLEEEEAKDLLAIKEVMRAQRVTQFIVVPSLWASLLDCLKPEDVATLRKIALGGEKVSPRIVETTKALQEGILIHNEYGPTEAAVTATHLEDLQVGQEITIGLPIANTRVYLLDQHMQLVPVGVPGEMYIAGDGLAVGYWNRPELTAERFVVNPWVEGERIYRTGDLGRRRADGRIEFVGRVDHQVKIRGYRIETGEIESGLLTHPAVKEAIVLDRVDGSGTAYLVAYVVGDVTLDLTAPVEGVDLVSELRDYLKRSLPDYMIPAHIVTLDQMPLTPNGKLDRRALPEPDETALVRGEYVAPASSIEATLAEIWAEVLGLEQVGVHHNFFDLGGHSLNAVKIIGLIHKRCNVAMTLRDLFQNPTVAGLASLIHKQEVSILEEIPVLPKQPYYELSYAQKRLWYINQMNSDSAAYNMAGKGILNEHVDEGTIQRAYERLIQHHESLRTCFKMLPEGLIQVIEETVDFTVKTYDLSALSLEEQEKK